MQLHARHLDEVIGLLVGGGSLGLEHVPCAEQAQALEGVALADAMGQGEDAYPLDEGHQALHLEVQGVFVGAAAGDDEVAEAADGRRMAQGVGGHHVLEQAVAFDHLQQRLA
ncbi:hypothetical protein D9M71_666470 [compost metagenome]